MKILENYVDSNKVEQPSHPLWWFDPEFKDSFEIFDLDNFYPEEYFTSEDPFPVDMVVDNYYNSVTTLYNDLTGTKVKSILEVGTSKGWFTKKFHDNGIEILGLEGTEYGIKECVKSGIPEDILKRQDFRKRFDLKRKFDLVICTEVAEHVEPCFSSTLVENIINHGDIIWFSSVQPYVNSPHYHHPNEQPNKFWINIFDYFGYGFIEIPRDISASVYGRGTHIYYNKKMYESF